MNWLDNLLFVDIFSGLRTTGKHIFKKFDTVQYPEEKRIPSERFRGMFLFDEDRCIKCCLCAMDCPIDIIFIEFHQEKDETGKAIKVLDRYDLDVKRCMFCGLCEEACPTEPKSIWLTTKCYETSTWDRGGDLYLDKEKLQRWHDRFVPFRAKGLETKEKKG